MITFCYLLILILCRLAWSQDSDDEQQMRAIWLMPNGSASDLSQTFLLDDTVPIAWTRLYVADLYLAGFGTNPLDLWAVPKQYDPNAAQLLQVNVSMLSNGSYDWTIDDVAIGDTGNVIYYLQFKFPTGPPAPRDFYNSSDQRNISSPEFWINQTSSSSSSAAAPSIPTNSMVRSTTSSTATSSSSSTSSRSSISSHSATTSKAVATATPANTGTLSNNLKIGLLAGMGALVVVLGGGVAGWGFVYMAKRKRNILYERDRLDERGQPVTPPPSGFALHSEITSHPLRGWDKKPEEMEMKDYYPGYRGDGAEG